MPTKTKTGRASRVTRPGTNRRKNKSIKRRQRSGGPTTAAPRVIANSLFALTLKAKTWGDIAGTISGHDHDRTAKVYKDLLRCYNNAITQLGGSSFIPSGPEITYSKKLSELITAFRSNVLPEGFEFNIDEHYNSKSTRVGFHFTIFKECDFREFWHYFEIRPVVEALKNKNPRLHDLFIDFISAFIYNTGIPTWWTDGLGYSDWRIPERLEEMKEVLGSQDFSQYDEEDLKKNISTIEKSITDYRSGNASYYKKRITSSPKRTPQSILKSLKRFRSTIPLIKFMMGACEMMKIPGVMMNFCYEHAHGDLEGLAFYHQVSIIWDLDDPFTKEEIECLDSEAQGCGVFPPILHGQLMPQGKMQDLKGFLKAKEWPMALSKIWTIYDDLCINIKRKKIKRS